MTEKEFAQRMATIKHRAVHIFKDFNAPVRSGELKASFKDLQTDNGVEITTDLYYMPYTDKVWISPRWRGRENPNEDWFRLQTEYLIKYMATHLGGRYVRTK